MHARRAAKGSIRNDVVAVVGLAAGQFLHNMQIGACGVRLARAVRAHRVAVPDKQLATRTVKPR